jgi:dihydrodipicolinate synthase/N-acetylneuraminate lyase
MVGNDALFSAARQAGAGALSAAAGAVPELMVAFDAAIQAGDRDPIDRLQLRLSEFLEWQGRFPGSTILKAAVEVRGLKTGPHSVPLSAAKTRLLEEFRAWFPGWLRAVKGG